MTGWAIEALLASVLLMLAVLLLRAPVRRMFGAQVAYALWALPVVRAVLPPLPEGWRGEALPVLPAPEPIIVSLGRPVATLPVDAATGDIGWPTVALAIWLVGAATFMAWQVIGYLRFRYRVLRHGIAIERVGSVTVVQSHATSGPLAFGVLDRVVAFPRDFAARFDAQERELALEHELGHHARGDLIANWVALAMLALHWFNPVAWIAFRAFRADQEMANDAGVLARRGRDARHAYGCAIVKAAHGRALSPACHLNTVNDLKGRLKMLGRTGVSRMRIATGAVAIVAVALVGLGATASGTQAAERVRDTVEEATGADVAQVVEAPAVPDAPAVPKAQPVPEAPAVPAAPRTTGVKGTRVVIVREGTTTTYEGDDAEAAAAAAGAPVPPVPPAPPASARTFRDAAVVLRDGHSTFGRIQPMSSVRRACSAGEGGTGPVFRTTEAGRSVMVVCTDRIAAIQARGAEAAKAAHAAETSARLSMRVALASLQHTRRGLAVNPGIPAEERQNALSGIDRAITELKAQVARRD